METKEEMKKIGISLHNFEADFSLQKIDDVKALQNISLLNLDLSNTISDYEEAESLSSSLCKLTNLKFLQLNLE